MALVVHDQTSRTGIERRDGFVNQIEAEYPDIEIVSIQYGGATICSPPRSPSRSFWPIPISRASSVPMRFGHRCRERGHRAWPGRCGGHRLRLGRSPARRDPVGYDGGRHHAEPGRHRLWTVAAAVAAINGEEVPAEIDRAFITTTPATSTIPRSLPSSTNNFLLEQVRGRHQRRPGPCRQHAG